MPPTTDARIRPIVWLLGLTPFVLVIAIGVYLLAPGEHAPARRSTVAPAPTESPASMASMAADPAAPAVPPPATPPVALASAAAAPPSAAPAGSADERREIDALLVRPPGSEQWTDEQKIAHRAQVAQELRRRERDLEWDIAAAHRSGDTARERAKADTLDHVRRLREALEAPLQAPSGAPLPADAGATD
jgi:hypothetical protein